MSQSTAYADFRAKQEARKAAAKARITAKTVYQEKEESAKNIPDNLKVIANFTVGSVQQVSDVTVTEEQNTMKEWSVISNKVQGITAKDDVSYILVKDEEGVEKYVLADNYEAYNSINNPNKVIVVTTEKELGNNEGLKVVAAIQNKINAVSDCSDVKGNKSMTNWAIVSNKVQGVTVADDVAYILVKSEDEEGNTVEKYVLTDNFEVYNELGKPNKLIVVTEKDDIVNVPVVTVEEGEESAESSETANEQNTESSSQPTEEPTESSESAE